MPNSKTPKFKYIDPTLPTYSHLTEAQLIEEEEFARDIVENDKPFPVSGPMEDHFHENRHELAAKLPVYPAD